METLTDEERKAISSLHRLAKRWPRTLMLVHSGSSGNRLHVKRVESWKDNLEDTPSLATINIPADSCA